MVDPVTCERATFDIEAHDKHGAHNPSAFQRILAAPQLIECVLCALVFVSLFCLYHGVLVMLWMDYCDYCRTGRSYFTPHVIPRHFRLTYIYKPLTPSPPPCINQGTSCWEWRQRWRRSAQAPQPVAV